MSHSQQAWFWSSCTDKDWARFMDILSCTFLAITQTHALISLRKDLYELLETFTRTVQPGAYLYVTCRLEDSSLLIENSRADTLPFLRYLPEWLAPWKTTIRRAHEQ